MLMLFYSIAAISYSIIGSIVGISYLIDTDFLVILKKNIKPNNNKL